MELKSRNQTQVSMNLTDYEETPIFRAFEMVKREAARYGAAVVGSEIVGLIPQAALNACSEFYLQIENFSNDLILERRLQSELSKIDPDFEYEGDIAPPQAVLSSNTMGAAGAAGTKVEVNAASDIEESVEDQVMTNVARANAGIDGCGAAAIAGSLAAALGKLVCNLMIEQKKSSGGEARGVLDQLDQLTADLREASAEESKGRKQMAEALALPRDTDAGRLARGMALEQATKNAVSAPLRIARTSMEVIELLNELTEIGNPTAVADVATGAQLAMTAMRGAGYVLLSDLMSVSDEDFNRRQRTEITDLITRGRERADEIEALFFTLYPRD
jgi:glutamate formiminotransferase/formiminotetrahydrofolate cyclodeaminase